MRILGLEIENILNLRAVSITPDGRVISLTGKNGAGKSAVLNAMYFALAGGRSRADEMVRIGEHRATVKVTLGESEAEIIVVLRVSHEITTLNLYAPDGTQFKKPQTMLSALIGQLTFDPIAFSRLKPEQRLDMLRKLVTLDVDVDALDRLNERDHRLRSEWNSRARSFADRVATVSEGVDASIDVTLIDVSALLTQMQDASMHNTAVETEKRERQASTIAHRRCLEEARTARDEAASLVAKAERLERDAEHIAARLENAAPIPAPVDVAALRHSIDEATKTNSTREHQARQRGALAAARKELDAAKAESDKLTAAMEERTSQKEAAIAAAKMPIDGLGFGNGDVTYKGLPFAQASTGEQLRVATAIGMALNPKLRVLFVRDASLLDAHSKAIIYQMAEEKDFDVWLESTQDTPTVGIHIVDGAIAAIDGVPVGSSDPQQDTLFAAGAPS